MSLNIKKKFWRKFQVLNHEYRVFKAQGLLEQGYQGVCDPVNKEIMIDGKLKNSEFNRTLMHELFHAHQHESGLGEILDYQAREMAAETLAAFICAIMRVTFISKPKKNKTGRTGHGPKGRLLG